MWVPKFCKSSSEILTWIGPSKKKNHEAFNNTQIETFFLTIWDYNSSSLYNISSNFLVKDMG